MQQVHQVHKLPHLSSGVQHKGADAGGQVGGSRGGHGYLKNMPGHIQYQTKRPNPCVNVRWHTVVFYDRKLDLN